MAGTNNPTLRYSQLTAVLALLAVVLLFWLFLDLHSVPAISAEPPSRHLTNDPLGNEEFSALADRSEPVESQLIFPETRKRPVTSLHGSDESRLALSESSTVRIRIVGTDGML